MEVKPKEANRERISQNSGIPGSPPEAEELLKTKKIMSRAEAQGRRVLGWLPIVFFSASWRLCARESWLRPKAICGHEEKSPISREGAKLAKGRSRPRSSVFRSQSSALRPLRPGGVGRSEYWGGISVARGANGRWGGLASG